jgi:hypothetical protein
VSLAVAATSRSTAGSSSLFLSFLNALVKPSHATAESGAYGSQATAGMSPAAALARQQQLAYAEKLPNWPAGETAAARMIALVVQGVPLRPPRLVGHQEGQEEERRRQRERLARDGRVGRVRFASYCRHVSGTFLGGFAFGVRELLLTRQCCRRRHAGSSLRTVRSRRTRTRTTIRRSSETSPPRPSSPRRTRRRAASPARGLVGHVPRRLRVRRTRAVADAPVLPPATCRQ